MEVIQDLRTEWKTQEDYNYKTNPHIYFMRTKIILLLLSAFTFTISAQTVIKLQKSRGVYSLKCTINDLPLDFIFDSGASTVCISSVEAIYMLKQGLLTAKDIIGKEYSTIADGSIVEGTKIILRKVQIGGLVLRNIEASVSHSLNAPLLLGQSALSKLGRILIDYDTSTLTILSKEYSPNSSIKLDEIIFGDSCSYYKPVSNNKILNDNINRERIHFMSQIFNNYVSDDSKGWTRAKRNIEREYDEGMENSPCAKSEYLLYADHYYQNNNIISITYEYSLYGAGAANAISGKVTHSFNKRTGERVDLEDLIFDTSRFLSITEKQFRKEYNIPTYDKINNYNCFNFKNGNFCLPSQFEFTENGIRFYYGLYEVACRIAGLPEFTVPYSNLIGVVNHINL